MAVVAVVAVVGGSGAVGVDVGGGGGACWWCVVVCWCWCWCRWHFGVVVCIWHLALVLLSRTGEVIGQRIEPDVHDVVLGVWDRDAPAHHRKNCTLLQH